MIELPVVLQTRQHLDAVLRQAVSLDVSDVHFTNGVRLSVRQHGVILPMSHRALSFSEVSNLLVASQDENTSCLSLVNSGEDLNFAYACRATDLAPLLRFRVNASSKQMAGKAGLALVFRAINSHPPGVDDVESDILACMTTLTQGLAIVAGQTGSGKSTLLAGINRRRLETRAEIMITHESPIEYVYDAVKTDSVIYQREIGRSGDYKTFYEALVGALRQDPDLIVVGEARDRETINAVINGVQTGHALFTTVHTQGVAQTINRMIKEFESHEREAKLMDMIDALAIIIYQVLVPAKKGGRIALREYLLFDGEVKDRLREAPLKSLFSQTYAALIAKGQTLLKDAQCKLDAGLIEESVYRKVKKQFESDISQTNEAVRQAAGKQGASECNE